MGLIRADFRKAFKSVYILGGILASMVCGAAFAFYTKSVAYIDDVFIVPFFVIISASLSIFIGTEHSDGGIRNKIVSGHKKGSVYLSLLLVGCAFSILGALGFLGVFSIFMAGWTTEFPVCGFIGSAFGFVLVSLSCSFIFVTLASLISRKAVCVVVCIVVTLATVMVCYFLDDILQRDEYFHIIHVNDDGTETEIFEKNPAFVGGNTRKAFDFIKKMTPYGCTMEYTKIVSPAFYHFNVTLELPADDIKLLNVLPLYSMLTCLIFGLFGYMCFRKKELK